MIWPIDTPSVSPCTIERTKDRIDGVSHRAMVFARASLIESPMLCSWSVSRSSSPSGPVSRSDAIWSDPTKPRPASTVTTRRSISSGSS